MKRTGSSQETKRALAASLKKLMNRKPLSKITINEIVQDCGVNRNSFYYHFEDIYALFKWMLEQEAVESVRQFDLMLDYREAIQFVMDYVSENRHIVNGAYDAMGREGLKRFSMRTSSTSCAATSTVWLRNTMWTWTRTTKTSLPNSSPKPSPERSSTGALAITATSGAGIKHYSIWRTSCRVSSPRRSCEVRIPACRNVNESALQNAIAAGRAIHTPKESTPLHFSPNCIKSCVGSQIITQLLMIQRLRDFYH